MLVEALTRNNIDAIIKSDDIGITFGSHGTTSAAEVEVWVDKRKLEKAKEITDQILDGF